LFFSLVKDWPAIKSNENSLLLPLENKKNITDLWQLGCHTSCEKAKQCNPYSGKVNKADNISHSYDITRESCWITENHLTTRYSFSECYFIFYFFSSRTSQRICAVFLFTLRRERHSAHSRNIKRNTISSI